VRIVILCLAFLPAVGLAQDRFKGIESRLDSAIGGVVSYLRSEKPKRGLDLNDNLNLWQPGLGLGAQMEMSKNWKLRLDVDRYRPKYPGGTGRENLDTVMVGIQYVGD
jgi:hypothetical protein